MGRRPSTSVGVIATLAVFCAVASPALAQSDSTGAADLAGAPNPESWGFALQLSIFGGGAFFADADPPVEGTLARRDAGMGFGGLAATLFLRPAYWGGEDVLLGLDFTARYGGPDDRLPLTASALVGWRSFADQLNGGIGGAFIALADGDVNWVRRGAGIPLWLQSRLGGEGSGWFLTVRLVPALTWRGDSHAGFAFIGDVGASYRFPL